MSLNFTIEQKAGFSVDEVRNALADTLTRQLKQAVLQRDYYQKRCLAFEQQYRMDSESFLAAFETGELGDEADFFDWYGMKRIYDSWERRVQILSGVSVGSE